MDGSRIQKINPSRIALVAKRVHSVEFDGGEISSASNAEGSKVKAQFNINNSITGKGEGPEHQETIFAELELAIDPEEGYDFYSLKVSVSGVFIKANPDISEDEFEKCVLTDGMTELYSYARSVTNSLAEGGLFGDIPLPMLNIEI